MLPPRRTAEEPDAAGDDVKLIAAGLLGFRIERDILGVLDQHAIAAFQHEDEPTKRHRPDETVNLGSDRFRACHESSIEKCLRLFHRP